MFGKVLNDKIEEQVKIMICLGKEGRRVEMCKSFIAATVTYG
jgi:hypothetical protein